MTTGKGTDLFHDVRNYFWRGVIVPVACFAALEIDVRVLGGAALHRMLWVLGATAKVAHGIHVDKIFHTRVIDFLNFLYFVRGAKSIKEMQKWYFGL
ncbi:MAG: hypothetical protein DDT34_00735 [Firmicutes bacterium]|nr:hypothetical protein [Bacillota bacterium]